jgi:hypothetical protein
MQSIIEGYNYYIFISYRQKDNKHDDRITEFVENPKNEPSLSKQLIEKYFYKAKLMMLDLVITDPGIQLRDSIHLIDFPSDINY